MPTPTNEGTSDLLSIVEAAYAMDVPLHDWTRGLLEATDRSMGLGLAGFACSFNANLDGTFAIDRGTVAAVRQPLEMLDMILDGLMRAPPGWLSSYLKGDGAVARCLMTSEVDPQGVLKYRASLARSGVHDGVNVVCMDLDQRGLLVSLGVPAGPTITAARRADLVRVGTHILTALRLRTRLAAQSPGAESALASPEPGGAVFFPDGQVAHADGDAVLGKARRALETAVRDITEARTKVRGDARRALGMWKGLVSGQWTLVDHFESGGERYMVARENAPRAKGLAALTPTERAVVLFAARGSTTKEIAYTLGISDNTVRVLLMRAARRYGVRTREALLALGRRALAEPG
jgi:DNA-binding CsgD family transcriptional regulator